MNAAAYFLKKPLLWKTYVQNAPTFSMAMKIAPITSKMGTVSFVVGMEVGAVTSAGSLILQPKNKNAHFLSKVQNIRKKSSVFYGALFSHHF